MKPDSEFDDSFSVLPLEASNLLQPIRSWSDMHREMLVTGVEFDLFWYENARDGMTHFFSWLGEPRATVLAVFNDERLPYIECRKSHDVQLAPEESMPIVREVLRVSNLSGLSAEIE